MEQDRVEIMLRRCRGRDRGIGRVTRDAKRFLSGDCVSELHEGIYRDPISAVAFQAVVQSMSGGSKVLNFDGALDLLGEGQVRKAALAAGVIAATPERDFALLFDSSVFQRRCLLQAFLFEALAEMCDLEIAKDAFVAGLLMDVGYLLMYESCDSDFQLSLYSRINDPKLNVIQTERFYTGIDHCSVSAAVAKEANLNCDVIEGIRHHHDPDACDRLFQKSADLCHIVSWLCDNLQYRIAPGLKKQVLDPDSLERLSWGNDFKENIADAVKHATLTADMAISTALAKIENVRKCAI